jgi:hypothetical protein
MRTYRMREMIWISLSKDSFTNFKLLFLIEPLKLEHLLPLLTLYTWLQQVQLILEKTKRLFLSGIALIKME